jgi:hypothetical protein
MKSCIPRRLLIAATSLTFLLPLRTSSAQDDTPLPAVQVQRWATLFAYVLEEFHRDHRDPTAKLEGDFSTRLIRVRTVDHEKRWASLTVSERDLETGDLRAIARDLYAKAQRLGNQR